MGGKLGFKWVKQAKVRLAREESGAEHRKLTVAA